MKNTGRKRKKLPEHVWARILRIKNGVYQPKIERKIKNSKRPEIRLDWIEDELKYIEIEEKLLKKLD